MVIFEANAFKEFARIRILAERCQNELALFVRQQGAVLKRFYDLAPQHSP
jgi:hypothetical protein